MPESVCGACGGHLLAGVPPMEPPWFCPQHGPSHIVQRMTGDEARAEAERLRQLTEGDHTSVYWENKVYREALNSIADTAILDAQNLRDIAADALATVDTGVAATGERS